MHQLISIEKSKWLTIASAIAVLAAVNWANTTKQELFELNHDIEQMPYVSNEERSKWSNLDGAIYKFEHCGSQLTSCGLVGPPTEATYLAICRNMLRLSESATSNDVSQLIKIRLATFNTIGTGDSMQEALAVLGLSQPIDTRIILNRLLFLDSSLVEFGSPPRYGQANGMFYRVSNFKLLNEMRAKAIDRAKLIDDLTFGLL